MNRVGDRWVDQCELSGHWARGADLAAFGKIGAERIRYPFLWERLAPREGEVPDWAASDAAVRRLREDGRGHEGDRRHRLQHQAAAERLQRQHRRDRAQVHAAVGLRGAQAQQAQLREFRPGFGAEAAGPGDGAPALEAVAAVHPTLHGVAQLLFVVAEIEVHVTPRARSAPRCCAGPRWSRRRSSSCGS